MKVIILAGGLGKRLRNLVNNVPKVMADVNGVPFLYILLNNLSKYNVSEFIICVSYLKEKIINYFGNNFKGIPIKYSVEENPLGTGGAIKQAFDCFGVEKAIVLNGDTFVKIDYDFFYKNFYNNTLSIVLTHSSDASRYGIVEVDNNYIIKFNEKTKIKVAGLINAGVYLINRNLFSVVDSNKSSNFSFEKDILEKYTVSLKIKYFETNSFFIDIGVPKSYLEAQKLLDC